MHARMRRLRGEGLVVKELVNDADSKHWRVQFANLEVHRYSDESVNRTRARTRTRLRTRMCARARMHAHTGSRLVRQTGWDEQTDGQTGRKGGRHADGRTGGPQAWRKLVRVPRGDVRKAMLKTVLSKNFERTHTCMQRLRASSLSPTCLYT